MDEKIFIKEQETADREEIIRDLDSNIFVEAGAGAGKTSILVRRILNQLWTGRAKAEELAAITFTNKAAQELKKRIGGGNRKALHKAGPDTKTLRKPFIIWTACRSLPSTVSATVC